MIKKLPFLIPLLLLLGCTFKHEKPVISSLKIAICDDPYSFIPSHAQRALDLSISKLLFEGLVRENDKKNEGIELALAENFTITENKIFLFTIKDNALWSNGEKILAKHFVYSWEKHALHSPHQHIFDNIDSFKAISPKQLIISLKTPDPHFLKKLAHPALFISYTENSPKNIVSSGPYKIRQYKESQTLTLTKNNYYYDKNIIKIPIIQLLIIPDIFTASYLFKKNIINWLGQPWHQSLPKEIKEDLLHDYTIQSYPVEGTFWIKVNPICQLANKTLRQYIYNHINKNEIIDYVLCGQQKPAYTLSKTPLSNDVSLYDSPLPYVIKQPITLTYPSNILVCVKIAEVIHSQLSQCNIPITLQGVDYRSFVNLRNANKYELITQTGIAYYPYGEVLPSDEEDYLLKNYLVLPIYHMSYDYALNSSLNNIIFCASGSVDLKYVQKNTLPIK